MVEYTAFLLSKDIRKQLLSLIPSSYSDIIADHITFQFGATDFGPLFHPKQIEAYAVIDNHKGLQAIAVTVDGNKFRPDGGPYHITWSLNSSLFKPVDSNSLIQDFLNNKLDDKCIQLLPTPIHISATPVHICGDDNKTRTIRQLPSSPSSPPSPN
jgi:hypothetical protein